MCGRSQWPKTKAASIAEDTTAVIVASNAKDIDTSWETSSEPFYLVEVATGYDFDSLNNVSESAASILGSKVDMMTRIYRPDKGIVVPDNSEDEIYRGEYYPRRPFDDQNFVSIEMSHGYEESGTDTLKMVVFAGIYKSKEQADSVARILKDKISTVKTIKRELFMGCMH